MVLEEASTDPEYASSYDSTTEDSSISQDYAFDLNQLPKPAFFAPLLGYNYQLLAKRIGHRIRSTTELVKRPLTNEEASVLAYWLCRGYRMESYNGGLGFAAGIYRAYRTRDTWKYPLIRSRPDPEALRLPGGVTLLRGTAARVFHITARGFAYGYLGLLMGDFFGKTVGASIAVSGQLNDPRLKTLNEEIGAQFREASEDLIRQKQAGSQPRNMPKPSNTRVLGGRTEKASGDVDDASPTGNQGVDDYNYTSYSDPESTSTSGGETRPQRNREYPSWGAPTITSRSEDSTKGDTSSPPFFSDEDTDQNSPTSTSWSSGSGSKGGSAWDRIRRSSGQGTAPAQDPRSKRGVPSQQPSSSVGGNDYSYSSSDEEKQLAQEQAQKDFDALVDRERHGEDSGAGTGRGKG